MSKHLGALGASVIALALVLGGCDTAENVEVSAPVEQSSDAMHSPQATGWAAKTLPELAKALEAGEITAEALTQIYLNRISEIDDNGPKLQSILTLNPNALDVAREIDRRRQAGEVLPPLAGIPVVLKDNIETQDPMPTTAGAFVLSENITERDSPLVAGLRAQGAIILGKTNLSQWANFRSNYSISGWSALGGQVRNPHMLDRSPCGSSSGTGAAIAASLSAGGVGTETNGSIICPSHVNGIVGFKPTVGLVPQKYIIPISVTQDTAGPMTKTVRGAAMMLSAMATDNTGNLIGADYASGLSETALDGARIGVLRFSEGGNPGIIARFNAALEVLAAEGAEIVEIEAFDLGLENQSQKFLDVMVYEFKDGINQYLAETPAAVSARTLADVIAYNQANADKEMALFDQGLFDMAQEKGPLTDTEYLTVRDEILRATRENGIDKLLADFNVDVLVGPSGPVSSRVDPVNGDVWPRWAGAGYLAAVAGYPHLSVPMGDVHGIPIGVSFIGGAGMDANVLSYGYDYERASQMRRDPQYLKDAEARTEIKKATQK